MTEWLADQLGCDPDDLKLTEGPTPEPRGMVARYNGMDDRVWAIVLVAWAVAGPRRTGRRVVAATLPLGGAIAEIGGDDRIAWR